MQELRVPLVGGWTGGEESGYSAVGRRLSGCPVEGSHVTESG